MMLSEYRQLLKEVLPDLQGEEAWAVRLLITRADRRLDEGIQTEGVILVLWLLGIACMLIAAVLLVKGAS